MPRASHAPSNTSADPTAHAEALFDALCATPVNGLISPDDVLALVTDATTLENTTHLVATHILPGYARTLAWMRAVSAPKADGGPGVTLGDLTSPAWKADLEHRAVPALGVPKATWLAGAVPPALIRQFVAPALQDTLVVFARRVATMVIGSDGASGAAATASAAREAAGGLAGLLMKQVEKSTERLQAVGKAVVSGLGGEFEKRLATTAREFSEQAVDSLRTGLQARAQSPDGAHVLEQIRGHVLERSYATPLSAFADDAESLRGDVLIALSPGAVSYAVRESPLNDWLKDEIAAWFDECGETTVGELLDTYNLRGPMRAAFVKAASVVVATAALPALKAGA
jgi:hypothetical protein